MKVSASFLSSNNIPKDLVKLNDTDVDYIHVDIMDGKFVSNKTMPFSQMRHIYKYTSKRLDVHLMVEDPFDYIKNYAELNTEYITIHVEIDNVNTYIKQIRDYSIKVGLAISPDTEISELVPYLPFIDLILIMSVVPGKGGQQFIEKSSERVKEVKRLLNSYDFNNIIVNVDGGINNETVKLCKDADMVTSGSYIINSNDFQLKIDSLR